MSQFRSLDVYGGLEDGLELTVAGDRSEDIRARSAEGPLGRGLRLLAIDGRSLWRLERHSTLAAIVNPAHANTGHPVLHRFKGFRTQVCRHSRSRGTGRSWLWLG